MASQRLPQAIVDLSHRLAKFEFWGEFDADAVLGAIREKFGPTTAHITKEQLKEIFLGLGYDKEKVEEPAEGEEPPAEGEEGAEGGEAPPRPPPKKEVSHNAEDTFDAVAASRDAKALPPPEGLPEGAMDLSYLLPTLHLCKAGYGEPALRFAIKVADVEGAGALLERPLWHCLVRCSNTNFDAVSRNHLRRAWRNAEKQPIPGADGEEGAAEGEGGEAAAEGGEGGEGGEGEAGASAAAAAKAPKPKPGPEMTKIMIDSLFEKLGEEEKLQALLLKEVPIPEPPKEDVPAPAEEEA